ncbi:DUF503 domain-containing protein [Tuwongella immobilis]|uniref:DUF503 domain-containing protein n=1 Tax=Tuwongella immobilis TaxID=692036 RepID=A0A6C2YII5_9BACT|nr:DUF503 domain-containing protein [Tuwongella immobilis]VIP01227.1 Uncharacterized protein OS=Coprothermobacter proteolyticus (strain ATCC 35245 / DSM 5265 / BT) GN=COPRO5265_0945 PE=4 SV=1: DUF503 [Tuwongella immobilis]VTR97880.1 Uncharacterized protein OS=Coprothermobacter proteolyticus (strain ATCC 35245 / DSM 5265 / BT) GN=COPRO5265_0945 PE=4 SV=1: DUF503 [Tuwongella immobilis]
MMVGTLRVRMRVREARSLKDKRQVVRSILDRLRSAFSVAAAEVDCLDEHQVADLGIALVGPEAQPLHRQLEQIRDHLRRHPIAEYLSGQITVDRVLD